MRNPSKRYSIEDVLNSAWLQKMTSGSGIQQVACDCSRWNVQVCHAHMCSTQMIHTDVIKSMSAYANMENLKKTAVQVPG